MDFKTILLLVLCVSTAWCAPRPNILDSKEGRDIPDEDNILVIKNIVENMFNVVINVNVNGKLPDNVEDLQNVFAKSYIGEGFEDALDESDMDEDLENTLAKIMENFYKGADYEPESSAIPSETYKI